ncbi:MAG: efflux RND transporter periplasmic adaptor subunit [Acidimicrobiia bacterium]|nr:efflux RND transporter periplasmic adaptor subunit [Acidimicrobiia bacterium]
MSRGSFILRLALAGVAGSLGAGCTSATSSRTQAAEAPVAPVAVTAVEAVEQPIARFIRVTGSLTAEEQADVASEIGGRVIATPVERGTRVRLGAELVRLAAAEAEAQAREAEANAAQIEARLGLSPGGSFDVNAVPEVQNAAASYALAQNEFSRIQSLLDQRVVSQSEFDQRRTQMEATRQQVEVAKNAAAQQFQALQGARARVTLAQKALADTVVRAPFSGVVAQRLVSVGDYVNRGMRVAIVVRVDPLRVELTVPAPFISAVRVGQPVTFEVDAYPGRTFEGKVRYVSPTLETAQRALTVEAVVANPTGELKPGLFATARIEQPEKTPGVLVPTAAVQTLGGTSRVFVVAGDAVEERLVTTGQTADSSIEITKGLKAGERVATTSIAQLADGLKIAVR